MRKQYFIVLDVETANSTECPFVYDVGFSVTDRDGNVYEKYSYIAREIFFGERELMKSAYYAKKIPEYYIGIKDGSRKVASLYEIRKKIFEMFEKYNIRAICAYNAYFDTTALNNTQRFLTSSKFRWFFPYGTEIFCIWNMACNVICTQKKYYKFCTENGLVSPSGNISTSAETVYKFLTNNLDFEEEHKGLQDVEIETKIMAECYRKHKKMPRNINRCCWRIPQRKKQRA